MLLIIKLNETFKLNFLMEKLISKNERIFIAGGNGMAGSAIKRSLLKYGYGDNNLGGYIFTPSRKELDCSCSTSVRTWLKENSPSIVIIAAAKVGGILANSSMPADFLLENLKIQTNLIDSAWRYGVKRLLFLGSSCIYPKLATQPIKEEYLLSGPLETTNEWYAIAKICGIKLCESLSKQYNFDAISLMPTNLYGPGDNYDPYNSHVMASLISKFCKATKNSYDSVTCWGSGKPLREFLYVDDLGDAVVFALERFAPGKYFSPLDEEDNPLYFLNVGTSKDISIKDLAHKIATLSGFKGEIKWDNQKPDGTPKKQLNIQKISELGWEPKITLEDGIKKTIADYKIKKFKRIS